MNISYHNETITMLPETEAERHQLNWLWNKTSVSNMDVDSTFQWNIQEMTIRVAKKNEKISDK